MKVKYKALALVMIAASVCGCRHPNDACNHVGASGFFKENNITEVRYVKAAMHESNPKPVTIMKGPAIASRNQDLLAKADCGSWKREYADDRVMDGMRWTVEFVSGDTVVKRVDGFNAEPEGLKEL